MRNPLAIACLLAVVACGSSTDPTPESVAGTWALESVNGKPLPWVALEYASQTLEVTSEVLTVTSAGTFTLVVMYRETEGGRVTTSSDTSAGRYTLDGNTAMFAVEGDQPSPAMLNGNMLTLVASPFTFVFRKQ